MAGRHVTLDHAPANRIRGRKRLWLMSLAALVVLALGIVIGSRLGGEASSSRPSLVEQRPTTGLATPEQPSPRPTGAPEAERTATGAVAAAASMLAAFDADVLLDPARLRETVLAISSHDARDDLVRVYVEGARLARERLAPDATPRPVVFARTVPVGYRVERYTDRAATIAVWEVGIVGSGATVQPQQSWRTQRVTLTWEDGAWKLSAFESEPGPTPPLAAAEAADTASTLFQTIPTFESFHHARP